MDCDVLKTTHPLKSPYIYNGFNEVATYKLFGWTTLKDAKRFLWSHYNPRQVYDILEQWDLDNPRNDPPNHVLYRALGKLYSFA